MKSKHLLAAALTLVLASHAHAQRATDSGPTWRYRVLRCEKRLAGNPADDFAGFVGPKWVFKDGLWYSGDLSLVYWHGQWIPVAEHHRRVIERREIERIPERSVVEG